MFFSLLSLYFHIFTVLFFFQSILLHATNSIKYSFKTRVKKNTRDVSRIWPVAICMYGNRKSYNWRWTSMSRYVVFKCNVCTWINYSNTKNINKSWTICHCRHKVLFTCHTNSHKNNFEVKKYINKKLQN